MNELQVRLFGMQDISYRDFQAKLLPTVNKDCIIGIRTPVLRNFSKEFAKTSDVKDFLATLPHTYYEENNLHAFLIEQIKDFNSCVLAIDAFLQYVDNWATCDLMNPKTFKKHPTELMHEIQRWIKSDHVYTVRFGIEMLMTYYLDEGFKPEYLDMVAGVKSSEYYVNMMIAWYFATALAKQYTFALPYIEQHKLDIWIHNKTIQKAVESYRISDEQKEFLRSLRGKLHEKS